MEISRPPRPPLASNVTSAESPCLTPSPTTTTATTASGVFLVGRASASRFLPSVAVTTVIPRLSPLRPRAETHKVHTVTRWFEFRQMRGSRRMEDGNRDPPAQQVYTWEGTQARITVTPSLRPGIQSPRHRHDSYRDQPPFVSPVPPSLGNPDDASPLANSDSNSDRPRTEPALALWQNRSARCRTSGCDCSSTPRGRAI